jgi:hypothetical protein
MSRDTCSFPYTPSLFQDSGTMDGIIFHGAGKNTLKFSPWYWIISKMIKAATA